MTRTHPVRRISLRATFASQPLAHWIDVLSRLDVCWAPVNGYREALLSEHLAARGMVMELAGGQTYLGMPIRFSHEPGEVRPTAPRLGEHAVSVLRAAGLSEAELEAALKVV